MKKVRVLGIVPYNMILLNFFSFRTDYASTMIKMRVH